MSWKQKSAEICSTLFARAVRPLREAAARGNVASQFGLGRLYELVRDDAEAALWFRRAAERGHAAARYRLGRMLHEGRGLPRNDDKAARWLRMSADQGHRRARRYLKWMLLAPESFPERGFWAAVGVEMDYWHERLEEKGRLHWVWIVAVALFLAPPLVPKVWDHVAERLRGRGPDEAARKASAPVKRAANTCRTRLPEAWVRDPPEALRRQAEAGHAVAQYRLASGYEDGIYGARVCGRAVRWYRKSAGQGFAPAQRALGRLYEIGRGVPKDEAQALLWYRKAAEQGNMMARSDVERLEGSRGAPGGPSARQGGK